MSSFFQHNIIYIYHYADKNITGTFYSYINMENNKIKLDNEQY